MHLKAKHIQPIIMAGIMAGLMTGFVSWFNLGFPPDYFLRWASAFLLAWPLASCAAFLAIPISVRLTSKILSVIGPGETGSK